VNGPAAVRGAISAGVQALLPPEAGVLNLLPRGSRHAQHPWCFWCRCSCGQRRQRQQFRRQLLSMAAQKSSGLLGFLANNGQQEIDQKRQQWNKEHQGYKEPEAAQFIVARLDIFP
jgi:hypothetical protein